MLTKYRLVLEITEDELGDQGLGPQNIPCETTEAIGITRDFGHVVSFERIEE